MTLTRRQALQSASGGLLSVLAGCSAIEDLIATPPGRAPTDRVGSSGQSPGTANDEKAVVIGLAERPRGLDPLVVDHPPARVVFHQIFEGLFEYDSRTEPIARLANGEPEVSREGRRWTVQLRDDVQFHDGTPVRAADVRYSFEVPVAENTPIASSVEGIDRVSVTDDRTVQFDLEEPDSSFQHRLTLPVVPKTVREADRPAFGRETVIGSGPFELEDWGSDQPLRLHRAPNSPGDRSPNIEQLEFIGVEDPDDRAKRLRDSQVDVCAVPDSVSWSAITDVPDAKIVSTPRIIYFYLAFNCFEGPTADRRVREAVDLVFDMDQAVSESAKPLGTRQYSPVPRPVAEAWQLPIEQWREIPHQPDLDRAQDLFAEAGVPNDYPWRIIVPPDDTREQLAEAVASGLDDAGFTDTTVSRLEWGAFYGRYNSGNQDDYNMYVLGWQSIPDPGAFTYPLFGRTPDVLGISNGTFFGANSRSGEEAARKFDRARTTLNRAARRQLYIDGITTVLEERAHLPAYAIVNAFGVHDRIDDLVIVPTDRRLQFFGRDNNASVSSNETTESVGTDA